jgi:hypothetical protein
LLLLVFYLKQFDHRVKADGTSWMVIQEMNLSSKLVRRCPVIISIEQGYIFTSARFEISDKIQSTAFPSIQGLFT